jgi:hypothetical protein
MNTKYMPSHARKVCHTPTLLAVLRSASSDPAASGAPIIAPPPKPMIAMPVAMPRLSGTI